MSSISISTQTSDYVGGDTLEGAVIINIPHIELKHRGVFVSLIGQSQLHFSKSFRIHEGNSKGSPNTTSTRTTEPAEYTGKEILFFRRIELLSEGEFFPGSHTFPFAFELPATLPGSMSCQRGGKKHGIFSEIAYFVKANVITGISSFSLDASLKVSIWQKCDAPLMPRLFEKSLEFELLPVCRLRCPTESVVVSIRIPQDVFTPEDEIPLQLAICNERRLPLTAVSLKLYQSIGLISERPFQARSEVRALSMWRAVISALTSVIVASKRLKRFPAWCRDRLDVSLTIPENCLLRTTSRQVRTGHFIEFSANAAHAPHNVRSKNCGNSGPFNIRIPIKIVGFQSLVYGDRPDWIERPMMLPPPLGVSLLTSSRPPQKLHGVLSFHKVAFFYIDVDNSDGDMELVIECESQGKVGLRAKRDAPPHYHGRFDIAGSNLRGGRYRIVLSDTTSPKIKSGRFYVNVYGLCLSKSSEFDLWCELRKCEGTKYRVVANDEQTLEVLDSLQSVQLDRDDERQNGGAPGEIWKEFEELGNDIEEETENAQLRPDASSFSFLSLVPTENDTWGRRVTLSILDPRNSLNPLVAEELRREREVRAQEVALVGLLGDDTASELSLPSPSVTDATVSPVASSSSLDLVEVSIDEDDDIDEDTSAVLVREVTEAWSAGVLQEDLEIWDSIATSDDSTPGNSGASSIKI